MSSASEVERLGLDEGLRTFEHPNLPTPAGGLLEKGPVGVHGDGWPTVSSIGRSVTESE